MLLPLHGIATRGDLPLPFSFVVLGAALALTLSFVVLLRAWRQPRYLRLGGLALPRLTRVVDRPATRLVAQLLVLAAFAWAGLALLAGQDLLTKPIFGFVFVWVWVGLVPISLLLGGFWRATNPLRTVHAALCRLAGTDPERGLVRLPERLGVWPAALALFGFAWLELVQPDRTTLSVLRVWALTGWCSACSARSSSASAGSERPTRSRPMRARSPRPHPGPGWDSPCAWSTRWRT